MRIRGAASGRNDPREFQQLRTDPDAVPSAGREFNRIEHLLVRVPTYGPGGSFGNAFAVAAESKRDVPCSLHSASSRAARLTVFPYTV